MKVRILVGQYAYACIEHENGAKTDIRLEPGKSAPASLRAYAAEQTERAERLAKMAGIALQAAAYLESN